MPAVLSSDRELTMLFNSERFLILSNCHATTSMDAYLFPVNSVFEEVECLPTPVPLQLFLGTGPRLVLGS